MDSRRKTRLVVPGALAVLVLAACPKQESPAKQQPREPAASRPPVFTPHAETATLVRQLERGAPEARRQAYRKLDKLEGKHPLATVLAMTRDKDPLVRRGAVRAINAIAPPPDVALGPIQRLLGDADADVRLAALKTMRGYYITAAPLAPSLKRLLGDDDARVRDAAAGLAVGLVPKQASGWLLEALAAKRPEVRVSAVQGLSRLRGRRAKYAGVAIAPLRRAVADPHDVVRAAACEALGKLGPADDETIKLLERARSDKVAAVRAAATAALAALKAR